MQRWSSRRRSSVPGSTGTLPPTSIRLDADRVVAPVDPRIFGGFVEHMGRCVYEGIFDPASRHADEHGCRTDVLDALRRLGFTAMRYPGGNFVSGYDWRDGVGPAERRPERVERAWRSMESNRFGTDEFLQLSERMGWTPMMAVNLGTGRAASARELVSYCNDAPAAANGAERAANGRDAPYGVDLWCLGNEMDGPWQIGHTTVTEYCTRAAEANAAMREVAPGIETVACGSSDPNLPTFPSWDREVLRRLGPDIDHLSVHRYARNWSRDTARYVAFGRVMDAQLDRLRAVLADVAHEEGWERTPTLSVDEWNVWYRTYPGMIGRSVLPPKVNGQAPRLLEEVYTLEDALVVAGFLGSFLRNADLVRVANLAQAVNVIAPILTRGDDLLVQSIFDAFRLFSSRRAGTSLRVDQVGPTYDLWRTATVPVLDVTSIAGDGQLHVFVVNRSTTDVAPVEVEVTGLDVVGAGGSETLSGPGPRARNTWDRPDVVRSRVLDGVTTSAGTIAAVVPPCSVNAITVRTA